jgi:hypothetical protein
MAKRNIPRQCLYCNKPFLTSSDQIAVGNGRFCSRKCAYQKYPRKPPEERFWKRVNKTSGCWLWTGPTNNKGYGVFGVNYRNQLAHRFSYSLRYGPIESDMLCLHRCDIPLCVNPDHLFLGSQHDNIQDMLSKGRATTNERHSAHKLTQGDVIEIRDGVSSGVPQRRYAERFGVSPQLISDIVRNKKRRHV